MHSIITSYLMQAGKCALPNIGFFKIKYKPAEPDHVNKQILPPVEEIVFNEQAIFLSGGLVNYLAAKKDISASEAERLLNNFCKEWREKFPKLDKLRKLFINYTNNCQEYEHDPWENIAK